VFESFTGPAKAAILLAQDEAVALGQDFIGTEHLLLGLAGVPEGLAGQLLAERDVTPGRARPETIRLQAEAGISATSARDAEAALATLGIDVGEIRRRADETFGSGSFHFPLPVYAPAARQALERTVAQAQELGRADIGTEHMLLGLLDAGEGLGPAVLDALGVAPADLRAATLARAGASSS
jgi:ATP-dependent Clp protease ATP-binding subunit ClpC